MERFQDIFISCTAEDAEKLIDIVRAVLEQGNIASWALSEQEMERLKDVGFGSGGAFVCAERLDQNGHPYAVLALLHSPPGQVYVPNIVPEEKHELSKAEYNQVLTAFHEDVLKPALAQWAQPHGLDITKPVVHLDDLLPADLAKSLRAFSNSANKSALHPLDQARWRKFLIHSHKKGHEISSDLLKDILVEELSWPDEAAWRLASRYQDGIELLDEYDKSA
jgi:hypothetical protein